MKLFKAQGGFYLFFLLFYWNISWDDNMSQSHTSRQCQVQKGAIKETSNAAGSCWSSVLCGEETGHRHHIWLAFSTLLAASLSFPTKSWKQATIDQFEQELKRSGCKISFGGKNKHIYGMNYTLKNKNHVCQWDFWVSWITSGSGESDCRPHLNTGGEHQTARGHIL